MRDSFLALDMTWTPDGPCAYRRDDNRYMVARSPQNGWPATYTLVALGAQRDGGKLWDGSTVIATMTAADASERKGIMDALMEKCDVAAPAERR